MSPSISIRPSKDIRTNYAQISALTRQNRLTMDTTARFINKADASLCFGKLKNEGTIINEGILDQTVNAASIEIGRAHV